MTEKYDREGIVAHLTNQHPSFLGWRPNRVTKKKMEARYADV